MIKRNKHFILYAILYLVLGCNDSNAQNCTRFALSYHDVFRGIEMDTEAQTTMDSLMVHFFRSYPENLEDGERFSKKFQQKVFDHLPDSISKQLRLSSLVNNRFILDELYTLEPNGFSKAYNEMAQNFTSQYYLEGLSSEGMEIFVFQYVDHMATLFQLENSGADRVSPVKLKQMVLAEYKQFLSEADLEVVASGWDRKITDFISLQRKRDSAYAVSLHFIVPKIDSLKIAYMNTLKAGCGNLLGTISQEQQTYWKKITQEYLSKINVIEAKELKQMKEYDNEYYPNVLRYHEYFYELKKTFPSTNFWSWRKGPNVNVSPELIESHSECLFHYQQFESAMVEILEKYSANFAFPNYYFSGSQTYSEDKIKKIQISNAIMFSVIISSL